MLLKQSRFTNKTVFELGENSIQHTKVSGGSKLSFTTAYSDIDLNPSKFEDKNTWFRNAGLFWVVAGIGLTIHKFTTTNTFELSLLLPLGCAFMAVYHFSIVHYTMLNSSNGSIRIIQDKKHDSILDEITKRRNGWLLSEYGSIDFDNDPQNEISKFEWLFKNSVISEHEFESFKAKVVDYHRGSDTSRHQQQLH